MFSFTFQSKIPCISVNSFFVNITFKKCCGAETWCPVYPFPKCDLQPKWSLYPSLPFLTSYLITTWCCVSVSVSVTGRAGWSSRSAPWAAEVPLSGLLFIQPSLNPPLLPTPFAYGRGRCSVMEVCIDPARRWGWNTNRVNRINGAVTPGWGGVPGFSLAVCKLIAFCVL